MEIGLLTAFLGGALSLLSPCGALLLPGFLAPVATRRGGLLAHSASTGQDARASRPVLHRRRSARQGPRRLIAQVKLYSVTIGSRPLSWSSNHCSIEIPR